MYKACSFVAIWVWNKGNVITARFQSVQKGILGLQVYSKRHTNLTGIVKVGITEFKTFQNNPGY